MDLYRTALTSTRHEDLLNEAANDRLTRDARPAGIGASIHSAGSALSGRLSAIAAHVRVLRHSPRKAAAHS